MDPSTLLSTEVRPNPVSIVSYETDHGQWKVAVIIDVARELVFEVFGPNQNSAYARALQRLGTAYLTLVDELDGSYFRDTVGTSYDNEE